MLLSRFGRVEVKWTVTGDVDLESLGTPQVRAAGAWHDAALSGSDVTVLFAGPDAPDGDLAPDAVVLPVGVHAPLVLFADNPEVVVSDPGVIIVT